MNVQLFSIRAYIHHITRLGLIVSCFLGISACAGMAQPFHDFKDGQLFDLRQGTLISLDVLKRDVSNADVIYIGEEHYNPSHIQIATQILEVLQNKEQVPALAMEMLSWDGQQALNQWVAGALAEDQFLQMSHWEDNWGGGYENYRPLIILARDHQFPFYALNPPRELVRKVATTGLTAGLADPMMQSWDLPRNIPLDDQDYHKVIYDQIVQCHPELPQHVYQRIYEASIFRDAGMAKVIVDYLESKPDRHAPLVSYTGGGHIQYNIPIPKRVQARTKRNVQQVSIYLMAFDPSREEDVHEAIRNHIADYLWLTSLGPNGPQPRCG